MAHTVDSIFHQAHVSLYRQYDRASFVSLHGMAQKGLSVSNGTRLPLLGSDAAGASVARLTRELRSELPRQLVTTCNAHAKNTARYRLCGTTNVQGRHANGYPATSVVEPLRASGRFIHIEQSLAVRQQTAAVASAFESWLET